MKQFHVAALAALFSAGAHAQAIEPVSYYVAARLVDSSQQISAQSSYSPRAQGIVRNPDGVESFTGALAVGYRMTGDWRIEMEYVAPVNSSFTTQWRFRNPANGVVGTSSNVVETRSQRVMLNVYKDFALSQNWSVYAGLGLGWSSIEAAGYQNVATRRFASERSNNLAWSATIGVDYHITQAFSVGMGVRYADLGRYRTGRNTFTNVSGQRDEQHEGRLKDRNVFLEARYGF